MRATRRHLHALLEPQFHRLDRDFVRGIDSKPLRRKTRELVAPESLLSPENLLQDVFSGIGFGRVARRLLDNSSSASSSRGFRMSDGQALSDLASAISRAMQRNG